jgi:hypothetical protein
MFRKYYLTVLLLSFLFTSHLCGQAPQTASSNSSVSISVYERTRVDVWQWFAAPPEDNTYGYVESLVRLGIAQKTRHWDWQLELSQPAILDAPNHSVSTVSAQGQLGLGGTYYAANSNNSYPAAAFLKQGFARYHFHGTDKTLRLGRFEFVEGQEMKITNPTIAWLQNNRISNRLIGNFGFSNAQRSFDGADAHYGGDTWDITAMAARADPGVFNMNGNPELNVDIQYLALTRSALKQHLLVRAFGIGYHDGRTGLTKTDNRGLAVRAADHRNIRIATFGGDGLVAIPAGPGQIDFLLWAALQKGSWGALGDSANAFAIEGGYQFAKLLTTPWIRAGWFRSSGDKDAADTQHNTFFQILATPRVYARDPFYNLMNNTDEFVQIMDTPTKKLSLRSELHWLQLTSGTDLWYQGGGAYDNKVFGYVGRPANGHTSFASVADISADYQIRRSLALSAYYAHPWGKSVIGAIYPTDKNSQYGYLELVYKWDKPQAGATK